MSVVKYVLGLVVAVLLAAIGELVSDEIRARLDRVPLALLAMAARRLPPKQYKALYVEAWLPELRHVLQGDQATPITRLIHGIRFAASLWLSAPKIGRELADDAPYTEHLVRGTVRGELQKISYSPTMEFLGKHTAFVGGVGVGKTHSMKELVYFVATRSAHRRSINGEQLTLVGQIIFDVQGEYGGQLAEHAVIYKPRLDDAACCHQLAESDHKVMKPDCNRAIREIVGLLQAGRLVIVDLSAIKLDMQWNCTYQIVGAILDDVMDCFSHGNPTTLIQMYFEEAHHLFHHGNGNDYAFLYDRLAKEGRKFRIGICYTTQAASSIPDSVLSNTHNLIDFPTN